MWTRIWLGFGVTGTLVLAGMWIGCRGGAGSPAPPFDAALVPAGSSWYVSTLTLGQCTRACETRPGAMTASGTAPVPDCARVATAHCFTFRGPPNAGAPLSCWCDRDGCERHRAAMTQLDYGAPITDLSDCTALP